MAECFEFFDIKSRIMKSFDTLPLDVDFGRLLPRSNFSDLPCGGGGDGDDDGNNNRDNGLGGEEVEDTSWGVGGGIRSITTVVGPILLWIRMSTIAFLLERRSRMRMMRIITMMGE